MKKIGITQLSLINKERNEIRNSLDFRLSYFLFFLGYLPIPLCNELKETDHVKYLDELSPDGIILSGGSDLGISKDRDIFERSILTWSFKNNVPLLGICRGLQIINDYQKGSLVRTNNHVNISHKLIGKNEFNGIKVNSFHNHMVTRDTLGEDLIVLAETMDGSVEAFKHKTYNWLAIMWHFERNKEINDFDKKLILNHFL